MSESSPARIPSEVVESVADLMARVERDTASWHTSGNERPWFRGQADAGEPPVPSVLRHGYDEFGLTTAFRLRALSLGKTPETWRLDQWLFLMQHYGLPTRLLDWTESPLIACLFAIGELLDFQRCQEDYRSPHLGVWVIHPLRLNAMSDIEGLPNTWKESDVLENFKIAFGTAGVDQIEVPGGGVVTYTPKRFPVAVQPSGVDLRVAVQRSCFTVHGTDPRDFESLFASTSLVGEGLFKRYLFPRSRWGALLDELDRMGISFSTVYPDFAGLAKELKVRFRKRTPNERPEDVFARRR